jgi:hypothetical protein
MIICNVGLERRVPGPGRKRWESKNIQGLPFEGVWENEDHHLRFRATVHRDNPGWNIQGYARIDTKEEVNRDD